MRIIRMFFGAIIIIAALIGLALSVGIVYAGNVYLDSISERAQAAVSLISENLDTTADALVSIRVTIEVVNDSVHTLSGTAAALSESVSSTEPLFEQVKTVTTEDVPKTLETVQETIPNIVTVAGTIDDTLTALSGFGFNQKFFGREINIDLGIDYDPTQRFDDSMQALGDSLDGLPESLRGLSENLDTTYGSLEAVSTNIDTLAVDLADINTQVETIPPLLDSYLESVSTINKQLKSSQDTLATQLEQGKTIIMMIAVWFGLMQLAPLVLGIQLLRPKLTRVELDEIRNEIREETARIEKEKEKEKELAKDNTIAFSK
jgi:ABC-type transporter Mla subunit MlaD